LVLNAYYLLGYDWHEARKAWDASGLPTPPVMITVCNRTETAARVKHAFDSRRIHIEELCDSERILHIDSKVLKEAEEREEISEYSRKIEVNGKLNVITFKQMGRIRGILKMSLFTAFAKACKYVELPVSDSQWGENETLGKITITAIVQTGGFIALHLCKIKKEAEVVLFTSSQTDVDANLLARALNQTLGAREIGIYSN
jgi:hypothetical protein